MTAVFTQWEAGTWTHCWLQTATQPSTPPWSATTPGRTRGGLSLSRTCCSMPNETTTAALKVGCHPRCRFVSSLPLSDFRFTVSLSHDVPLATSLGHCLYVLGSVERTGEKLLLQYDTRQGTLRQQQLTEISPGDTRPKEDCVVFAPRLLVGAAPHSDQSRCRPSRPSLPGCH